MSMKRQRIKVASLKVSFSYVAENLLINKSKKDFWAIEKTEKDGSYVVIRQVDDKEFPIKE